ncbi:MAG: hypothetical protein WCS94_17690 [Verrucomicrobiota bacterium]
MRNAFIVITSLAALLAGCATRDAQLRHRLAGAWIYDGGDFPSKDGVMTSWKLTEPGKLTLRPDGSYSAVWGVSSNNITKYHGTWSVKAGNMVLKNATGGGSESRIISVDDHALVYEATSKETRKFHH